MNFLADPLVSVVIVNWNGAGVLARCLEALSSQSFRDFEIILVDNGSTDDSVRMLARWPDVRVVRFGDNRGFAVANNAAAQVARGEWLALLNNDAFPEPEWLEALVAAAQAKVQPAFFASCQIQANAPSKLDGTGDEYHFSGLAWRRFYDQPVERAPRMIDEVFSACGAAAFYPRRAFLQAQGFDEDFHSYLEDVDLGFRLRLLGYRCFYVPQARVLHVGSAALGKEGDFAVYHGLRNMIWVYVKNLPSPYIWKFLPAHLVVNLGQSIYYSFCCCPHAAWRSKLDALKGLSAMLRKRRKIQASRRVALDELLQVIRFPEGGGPFRLRWILMLPALLIEFSSAVRACRKVRQTREQG